MALRCLGVLVPLALIGACGMPTESRDETVARPDGSAQCADASGRPAIVGDAQSVEVVRVVETDVSRLDEWLALREVAGGPRVNAASYDAFPDLSDQAPLTVCLIRVDPRPIPLPTKVEAAADGVQVFVQDEVMVTDGIGSVESLAELLDDLEPVRSPS